MSSSSELFKKLRRPLPFEQSLGILGFLTVCLFLVLFFTYFKADGGFKLNEPSETNVWAKVGEGQRVGFLENGGEGCDLFEGKWVWDEGYPLYQEECPFIDEGFRCSANGRPDRFYTKWRWQPTHCDLPRFDANMMLEKLRNRRIVFVGDSMARNQWESLLCMLSSAVTNKDSIYEVNGTPITKHMGFLSFKFGDFNCTVEYYRSPFIILQSRPPVGVPDVVKFTLKLDQMDWNSVYWRGADVLVFNTGHWWNYEKTIKGGCYFQEGKEIKMNMSIDRAHQRSVETLGDWISRHVNTSKTQVFYRTYSPVHFRGGDWNTGGTCHLETLPELDSPFITSETLRQLKLVNDALSGHLNKVHIDVLNVTGMSSWRKDGHASLYYLGPKTGPASLHRQDCSHWCLPGVPDAWNELLYALFLKRDVALSQKSVAYPPL